MLIGCVFNTITERCFGTKTDNTHHILHRLFGRQWNALCAEICMFKKNQSSISILQCKSFRTLPNCNRNRNVRFFPFCSLCFILIFLMLFYCFLHLFCYTFLAYLCHVLLFPCVSSCGFARWRSANKNSTLTFCQTNGAWTTHRSINANNMQHGIHICCSASASWKIATFSIIVWLYFVHWNPCVSSDAVEENGTNLNKGKTGFHVQLFSFASRAVKHFVAPGVLT